MGLGRVSSTGFIPNEPRISKYRDTHSSSTVAVPPEEVLFRRQGAPTRYEEDDFYWADRHLTDKQKLPESDLLKAIHAYTSDFYGRATKNKGAVDFESLDETALLGLGILLEEMAGHVLGDSGDLAFVEGEEIADPDDDADAKDGSPQPPIATDALSTTDVSEGTREASSGYERKRKRKRRKLKHNAGDDG